MARLVIQEKKLAVLELVKEKKAVLFGSFQNNAVERAEKIKAWAEVLVKAQSLGLANYSREWSYARDHIFGLWKSRTIAKRDKEAKMNVVDEAILDILGTESVVVDGLELPEAEGVSAFEIFSSETLTDIPTKSISNGKAKSCRTRKSSTNELTALKKQLLTAQIYKTKLEILKLERELAVSPSIHTIAFISANNIVAGVSTKGKGYEN